MNPLRCSHAKDGSLIAESALPVVPLSPQLDEDRGGSLDIEELKGLLASLVEKAKQSAVDEAALEKSAAALRRVALEQHQVIAATQAAKAKADKEAEALEEQRAQQKAELLAEEEAERKRVLEAKEAKKQQKANEFEEKIKEKRRQALLEAEEAAKKMAEKLAVGIW